MDNIIEKLQNQWNSEWVRILVLASLSIQINLTFLAPLRKCIFNKLLLLTIWVLYLTADLVPPLALGNMGNQIGPAESDDLTVLWAPFLLLHLGGPDTITSYSIDDNELWWRLPLGLVVQVIAAIYVFWQSPPNPVLWIPTTFVSIAGIIKFVERTLALRSGSRSNIKDTIMMEINPTNDTEKVDKLLEALKDDTERRKRYKEEKEKEKHDIMNGIISEHGDGPANETEVTESERESITRRTESMAIVEGYLWFDIFKRLLVDVTFSSNLLKHSYSRFSVLEDWEALDLIAIELSFIYDILHTKAMHRHCTLGRVLHCSSLVSIIAAFVVFHHLDMQKYASKDITITYILFGAGLTLEVFATFLLVSSDWTVVSLRNKGWGKFIARAIIARAIASMVKAITFRKGISRWGRTIGHYNLVDFCLRDRYAPRTWIMKKLIKIKHKWNNMRESRSIPLLAGYLEYCIFNHAIRRAPKMHIYNEVVEARSNRGRKALKDHGQLETLGWSMNREFDECIILWHVATDICYFTNYSQPLVEHLYDETQEPEEPSNQPVWHEDTEPSNQPVWHEDTEEHLYDVSWKISNYMMYLLTQQQLMMQVGYGQTRFEVTCDVIKKIFRDQRNLRPRKAREVIIEGAAQSKKDEDALMNDMEDMPKNIAKKKLGENVLRDIRRLAKELQELRPEIRWKLISETWTEMLGYAAIHCDSNQHAKSLSRGGELLTVVWLLMAHLGVVEEYKMQQFQSDEIV